jgi:hypothetical protein
MTHGQLCVTTLTDRARPGLKRLFTTMCSPAGLTPAG